jgi:hypothetical protein
MVPVRRRNLIEYNFDKLKGNAPSRQVLDHKYNYQMPSALNHINRKLLLESKVETHILISIHFDSNKIVENFIFYFLKGFDKLAYSRSRSVGCWYFVYRESSF